MDGHFERLDTDKMSRAEREKYFLRDANRGFCHAFGLCEETFPLYSTVVSVPCIKFQCFVL